MSETALKALSGFPLLEAAAALLTILAGVWMILQGTREKKPATNGSIPTWMLYGPVRDLMQVIHEMAEQSREGNRTLLRIEDVVKDIAKEQREGTMLLEAIQNNQVMRGDIQVPPPPPPRRKSSI